MNLDAIWSDEIDGLEDICEWSVRRAVHGPSSIQHESDNVILRYKSTRRLPEGFPINVDECSGTICEPAFIFLAEEFSGFGASTYVPNTTHAYAHDLKTWFVFLEEFGVPWNEATSANLDSFLEFLKGAISPTTGAPYAAVTLNRRKMIVEKMYEFWRKQNLPNSPAGSLLARASTARKAKGTPGQPVQILTPVQQQTLTSALGIEPAEWTLNRHENSSRDRLYGDCALIAGLRITEIHSLKASQFFGFSRLALAETELYYVDVLRKGGRIKKVAFPGDLIREILCYMEGERRFILEKTGLSTENLILNPLGVKKYAGLAPSVRTIERVFLDTCLKIGFYQVEKRETFRLKADGELFREAEFRRISNYVFHDLRHTFAVTTYYALKHAGYKEPWLELADRLGHADPRTTIRYYLKAAKTFEGRVTDRVMEALRAL
ncbi:hypothetical protein DF147_09550 [Burkholderia cenocepacia]|nr:hypothetical protein DF147_09550 [Burkholderia cenocepacia]